MTNEQKAKDIAKNWSYPTDGSVVVDAGYVAEMAALEMGQWKDENRWVSVDDKLPEKDGVYFTLVNSKTASVMTFDTKTRQFATGAFRFYVNYWMEIPKLNDNEK